MKKDDFYQLDKISDFIKKHPEFLRISLQFPDDLLRDSAYVITELRSRFVSRNFSILADTSFGSCCVDEVAAEHANADLIVHFGQSCMSRPSRIPVLHIFCAEVVDCAKFVSCLANLICEHENITSILVLPDQQFQEGLLNIHGQLSEAAKSKVKLIFIEETYNSPTATPSADKSINMGRILPDILDNGVIVQFGTNEKFMEALTLDFYGTSIYRISPDTFSVTDMTHLSSRRIMKRYASISKASNADIIGILVGTLGVAHYSEIINNLKMIIKGAGKIPYVVLVGKLNPAKLANFSEIPVFVIVACPLNSIVDDKDYYQSIITPLELEVALGLREWQLTEYHTSFEKVLNEISEHGETALETISVIEANELSNEIVLRGSEQALVKSGLETSLLNRTWYGLDIAESLKEPTLAVEGRKGMARGYTHETQ